MMLRLTFAVAALMALAVAIGAYSPLGILNALTPTDTYRATEDVAYGPDPREKLDVYQPLATADTPAPRGGYPVVVFFYGGTWTGGERKDYRFVGEALASRAIVAVIADYRLYPQVRYPDFLTDCARALAWARREAPRFGGDRGRVYAMGTARALTTPRCWRSIRAGSLPSGCRRRCWRAGSGWPGRTTFCR